MSDKDRQACFESLPDMLDGFLKKWGWLHFAQAVEQTRDKQWSPIIESLQSERAALKKANETFEKQQKWWNERMFRLEQELERVKGQEPVAWANPNDFENFDMKVRTNGDPLHTVPLYTTPPAQPAQEPVATVFANAFNAPLVQPEPASGLDLHFFKQVLGVAIAGVYDQYRQDILNTFSIEELAEVVALTEPLQSERVEHLYKKMWDMLSAAQSEPTCQNCNDVLVGDKLDGALCCDCAYRPAEQGWMRVIDEEMVGAHLGVAHPADSYDEAKQKLKSLICWHVSVATNSAPTENKP
jgi:hypothetical protein